MRVIFLSFFLGVVALAAPHTKTPFLDVDLERYWSLDEIYDYMYELEAAMSGFAKVERFGTTLGGTYIRGIRIANEEHLAQEALPIVFVTAGASARDWISTMAAVNLMHELCVNYDDYQNIVDNVEWFIIPVANPDGYEFSRTEGNRAWIKNRRVNAGSDCIGVNVERNFQFNWGLDLQASNDPCQDDFRGASGDSEEETRTIQFAANFFGSLSVAYISIKAGSPAGHSAIAYPFSSNRELFRTNFNDQMSVASIMADAILRETGANYTISSEANIAGLASGTSGDYASGVDDIPLVYTIFAPSGGENGWDVPESSINDIVSQIFVGFTALGDLIAPQQLPDPEPPLTDIDLERYWSLDEIYDYMYELEAAMPGLAKVERFGTTLGGTYIRGIRIASEEHLAQRALPIVFVTAGASARDWISTMAAVNLMHELCVNYNDYQNIVDNVEWFIIPVANPDGYEFSRTEGNRAWIKNRRVNAGSNCVGVNIERNFQFNWGLELQASNDPCQDDFRGASGDSEEETRTIQFAADFFRSLSAAYVTIKAGTPTGHSAIAYPFSSNRELFRPQYNEQKVIANIMADAILRETGVNYRTTSEANIGGLASGTSGDYASGVDDIPLVYTIFTPSGGQNGWDVPESSISDIVHQTFVGFNALGDHVATLPLP